MSENSGPLTYAKSGVDLDADSRRTARIIDEVSKTHAGTLVDNLPGGFAGGIKLPAGNQTLVACTDGVGTKIDLANKFKKFDTIGIDLVAMCINDLIVQGAKPLFFLDYIAVGKLDLNKTKKILKGIFKGCETSKCKLIGGETAEMPGIYSKNKFDLAGFSVGIVAKKKILDKSNVKKGDIVLAIPSNGIHSNGYSLVRSILQKNKIPKNLKNEILRPTKIYSNEILKLTNKNLIKAGAHITGGELVENLLRSVPKNLTLNIDFSKIKIIKIFKWLKSKNISDREMIQTFNCGVGFCLIVSRKNILKIKKIFPKRFVPYEIGYITKDKKKVNLSNSLKW